MDMNKIILSSALIVCLVIGGSMRPPSSMHPASDKWISLFDGKTLNGWKVGENAATFSVDSGCIIAHGNTAHLFYEGDVKNHDFKDFEFKADVLTKPGSNSGI